MLNDLGTLVEQAIDAAIRFHIPGDLNSYSQLDSELQRAESLLLSAEPSPGRQDLLASVRAMRIDMAYDVENLDFVLALTSRFLQEVPASHPSFFSTILLRLRTLHRIGAHEEEIQTCAEIIKRPEVQGSEYVYLLEHLGRLHSGNIPEDGVLMEKMKEAVEALSAQGYSLPKNTHDPKLEQIAVEVAAELRRANRARGDAILAGET